MEIIFTEPLYPEQDLFITDDSIYSVDEQSLYNGELDSDFDNQLDLLALEFDDQYDLDEELHMLVQKPVVAQPELQVMPVQKKEEPKGFKDVNKYLKSNILQYAKSARADRSILNLIYYKTDLGGDKISRKSTDKELYKVRINIDWCDHCKDIVVRDPEYEDVCLKCEKRTIKFEGKKSELKTCSNDLCNNFTIQTNLKCHPCVKTENKYERCKACDFVVQSIYFERREKTYDKYGYKYVRGYNPDTTCACYQNCQHTECTSRIAKSEKKRLCQKHFNAQYINCSFCSKRHLKIYSQPGQFCSTQCKKNEDKRIYELRLQPSIKRDIQAFGDWRAKQESEEQNSEELE